jgi:REP element-mobilizing transposase RayT
MEVGRPERLRDFDYLGQRRYFLTFCTDHRRPLFISELAVSLVLAHERLWQPYGYEHVLRSDEATHAVVRYILENPVRAGLVEDVLDYPFCGSLVHRTDDLVVGRPQPG